LIALKLDKINLYRGVFFGFWQFLLIQI